MKPDELEPVPAILLIWVRAVALWAVIPLGFVCGICVTPWRRSRGVTMGQFLGWLDLNVMTLILKSILRPLVAQDGRSWVPAGQMPNVTHRIGIFDPY